VVVTWYGSGCEKVEAHGLLSLVALCLFFSPSEINAEGLFTIGEIANCSDAHPLCSNCAVDKSKQGRTREKTLEIISEFFKQEQTVTNKGEN